MLTRQKKVSNNEQHKRAAEINDQTVHADRSAAEARGKNDHLTGQDRSGQVLEHSHQAHAQTRNAHPDGTHQPDGTAFGHEEAAALAYTLW